MSNPTLIKHPPSSSNESQSQASKTGGYVKWFNDTKGFGFITADHLPNVDVFVHYSGITNSGGRKTLVEGDRVAFDLVSAGTKGPQAINVVAL